MIRYSVFFFFFFMYFNSFSQTKHVVSKYKNGNPKYVMFTKESNPNSPIVKEINYYESGKVKSTGSFSEGLENGAWIYYYENGNKKIVENYSQGVEHGKRLEYSEDGKLEKEVDYDLGTILKLVDYTKN
jgi:antitoxin component YwqK of YwqJK toxin-antitoxin module